MVVKKHANAVIAAQHRAVSNRTHLLTSARQFLGGAAGSQASVAALIGTMPRSVSARHVMRAIFGQPPQETHAS